jgi:murein DD-endopeptidase MepM/ murein hydrolase activator NlpD
VYRVNPGDTVAGIARSYNIPQSLLIDANGLSNPNVIFVGQTLTVPVQQAVTPAASVEVASETLSAAILPAAPVQGATAELPSVQMPALTPVSSPVAVPDSGIGGSSTASSAAPAVPTLLAQSAEDVSTQSSDETALPRRQVAVAPVPESAVSPLNDEAVPVQTDASPVSPFSPYVASLLSEIKNLQQRNQPTAAAVQPELTPAAVQSPAAGEVAVSPHFSPSGVDRQVAATRSISTSQPSETPAESSATSGLVATAPLGSESYDPLLQPITGRMVSPDLPPLPGADTFLPEDGLFNGYVWPTRGLLTSGYGWRWGRMHQGIDIAADIGTPIYAAATGVVEFAGWNSGGYGNMVEIRHADGSMTRYAHMNAIYVRVGQQLSQGEQVGEMGSTGYSTGPHLHFEVHLPDQGTVNPMAYLPAQ